MKSFQTHCGGWSGLALVLMAASFSLPARHALTDTPFRVHTLSSDSEFSAATVIDIDGDGRPDVVSGAFWYQAPDWDRHTLRDVTMIRGRFDDYSNLAMDVDGDDDLDIISVNYRSKSLYWCRNPGPAAMRANLDLRWQQIEIDRPGSSETGRLVDIDGDGHLDILPSGTTFAAWYRLQPVPKAASKAAADAREVVSWQRYDLPAELIGHGVGAGDVNGDGRVDVVGPSGWALAPPDPLTGRWRWQPEFNLANDCGLPILVHDVDSDGDADLIWSRGHNYGIYWTEQVGESESSLQATPGGDLDEVEPLISSRKWITHAIDTRWSCAHTLVLADMDGDGNDDLVAGKRFLGHDGKDPGESDPLQIAWYGFDSGTRTWQKHLASIGGTVAIDLDTVCEDIDGDGDVDILAPSRSGLHWLENTKGEQGNPAAPTQDNEVQKGDSPGRKSQHRDASALPLNPARRAPEAAFDLLRIDAGGGEAQRAETPVAFGPRRQQILAAFESIAGALPGPHRRRDLDVQISSVEPTDKYWRIKLSFASDNVSRVPAYLLVPMHIQQRMPAMLCLHPSDAELGKAEICGLGGEPSRFYAHELAERGFVCLAPDYPNFGEYEFDFAANREAYPSGTIKAVWDNVRVLDLLESLPCVERDRIGVIGHSHGGRSGLFTAALDGRVRAVVTSCGFTALADYRRGDLSGWTVDRYMPAIAGFQSGSALPFDFPELLATIVPRPLFVSAPLRDETFDVAGVRKCEASLKPVVELYRRNEKPGDVRFVYPDNGHEFPKAVREEAYQWLRDVMLGKD
ncbi:FG-GAP repeat protein [Rosistilla ulvae]|uniref:FG-GAP repeat protein n=1 Tax=Rosistilla ulvae TaxID=1930277 RepID=A0A517M089_9BACT|nr:FG-GAP-like repeat-containing protein [Rosistilla ulvae]QDS88292.1 FG-GAP repeat protein [Rosistilla ulvae]